MNQRTMLIVEDEYYLADDCSRLAEASGFRVIGALQLCQDSDGELA
jgi:hypothetical protein